MTRLIIFDLDGTLLDTIDDLAAACNHALMNCGCPARQRDEYYRLVGRGIDNLFRGALPESMKDDGTVRKMRSFFVPYYNAHGCDLTKPYDGITEMLEKLSDKGIKLAVASNKYQEGTEALVKKFFSGFDFVRILGQREGKPIKPDPQIVLEAMEGVPGIRKDEVIYCGDSDVDMQTGNNAEVKTIGVTWGFRTKEELLRHNPCLLADTPGEIYDAATQDIE
jgi:phosphoglycolate phosphatase